MGPIARRDTETENTQARRQKEMRLDRDLARAAVREERLARAADELHRTIVDLKPGEVLEITRNSDDANALLTIARYSVRDKPPGVHG